MHRLTVPARAAAALIVNTLLPAALLARDDGQFAGSPLKTVVWPYQDMNGVTQIRCFIPGAGA